MIARRTKQGKFIYSKKTQEISIRITSDKKLSKNFLNEYCRYIEKKAQKLINREQEKEVWRNVR